MKTTKVWAFALLIAACGSVSAKSIVRDFEDPKSILSIKEVNNLKFKLNYSTLNSGQVTIKIMDETGNEIYSQNSEIIDISKKLYDLSNLNDGKYTFTLKSGIINEKISIEIKTQTNRTALLAMN
jgi:hypothetical protein